MADLLNAYSANIPGFGGDSQYSSSGSTTPKSTTYQSPTGGGMNPEGRFGIGGGIANPFGMNTEGSPFNRNTNQGGSVFNIQQRPQMGMPPPPPVPTTPSPLPAPPSMNNPQQTMQQQINPAQQGMMSAQEQALLAQLGAGAQPGMPQTTPAVNQNAPIAASQPRNMPQFM